jgi:dipeptidase D
VVVLATVEEEVGLDGARNISFAKDGKVNGLLEKTKYFINADGEDGEKITIGCAGHEFLTVTLPLEREPVSQDTEFLTLHVSGLQGGHSGINAERISANSVLAQWLDTLKEENGWRISEVKGGEFDNAIPTSAEMTIGFPKDKAQAIKEKLQQHPANDQEQEMKFSITLPSVKPEQLMTEKSSRAVASILSEVKDLHGVDGYFEVYGEKMPTRSLNFAIVDTSKPENQIKLMSRLGRIEEQGKYREQLKEIAKKAGAQATEKSWMSPWQPDEKSQLPTIAKELYQEIFGKPLVLEVTRGGLELGPLHEKFPQSEKIALATTITGAHSATEQVEVQSIADCYLFLSKLVEKLEKTLITGSSL